MAAWQPWTALVIAVVSLSVVNAAPQAPQRHRHAAIFHDGHNTPFSRQVHQLIADPSVSRAHWGIAIANLDGTPVFGSDEDKLFRPASTAKLFTTAAALNILGPEFRTHTRAYGDVDLTSGLVRGDLTVVGGGDVSFGTEDLPYRRDRTITNPTAGAAFGPDSLQHFADDLVRAGVRQIAGRVIGDDSLFETPRVPQGWAQEDLLWGYGALPSALTVGDSELTLTIAAPTSDGTANQDQSPSKGLIDVDQLYPYLSIVNATSVLLPREGQKSNVDAEAMDQSATTIRIFGRLAPGAPELKEHIALHEPALYTSGALRALLLERDVHIEQPAAARHAQDETEPHSFLGGLRLPGCEASLWDKPASCALSCPEPATSRLLVDHVSRSLMEDITFTLKTSANLHAEVLLHQLGLQIACQAVTSLQGARVLRAWLLHHGIPDGDFLLYDGSGLSTKDLVTPRAETQILAYAASQTWFPQWLAALPTGGVDGTLASRFTDPFMRGRVFAKTGTLGESRALAGYVRCASGRQLIFSILVDDHEPGVVADREVMDKIVTAVARSY